MNKVTLHYFFASKAGSLTDMISLIKQGANVNHVAKNGKTPLFRATSYETAMLLLNHGANPYKTIEVKDKNGNPFPTKQTVIEHLLKFGSECPKAILDASMQKLPDDTLIMDFEVFKGKKNLKEKNNLQLKDYEISLFLQAIDNTYNSLLIHPLMQIFLILHVTQIFLILHFKANPESATRFAKHPNISHFTFFILS